MGSSLGRGFYWRLVTEEERELMAEAPASAGLMEEISLVRARLGGW